MAIGVDTSRYKPRKIKGTPAHIVRNRIAYGILTVGIFMGLGFHFGSFSRNLRKASDVLLTDPIEEVERKQLMALALTQRTGDQIRRKAVAESNPAQPHIKKRSKLVTSEFFTNTKMDDSFKDFREPKKHYAPKTMKAKSKTRKIKKVKGQSDIRKAVSKMNDLVSYTEDFNMVCVESGIDVDAEQLQLAMAMSKSIQEGSENASEVIPEMSSQERRNKIKATLLEYGFHVPDNKISKDPKKGKRRFSKIKAESRLLNVSEDERQQIINDRYREVLVKFNEFKRENFGIGYKNHEVTIINMATNLPYNLMLNKYFFIEGIAEEVNTKLGGLLRNWSDIIGRPKSPTFTEPLDLEFTDVTYTQEELDVVLSGKFSEMKVLVKDKQKYKGKNGITDHLDNDIGDSAKKITNELMINKVEPIRCMSPDIFDDELSLLENRSLLLFSQTISQEIPRTEKKIINRMSLSQPNLHCAKRIINMDFIDHSTTNLGKQKFEKVDDILNRNSSLQPILGTQKEVNNDLIENNEGIKHKVLSVIDESIPLSVTSSLQKTNSVQINTTGNQLMDSTEALVKNKEDNNDEVKYNTGHRISFSQPRLSYTTINSNFMDYTECLPTNLYEDNHVKITEEHADKKIPLSQPCFQTTKRDNIFMDLTKCCNVSPNKLDEINTKSLADDCLALSQRTKTESAFMDLTECLVSNVPQNKRFCGHRGMSDLPEDINQELNKLQSQKLTGNIPLSQCSLENTKRYDASMDLTDCLDNNELENQNLINYANKPNIEKKTHLSQDTLSTNIKQKDNVLTITRRISNDFMDLTDCNKISSKGVGKLDPIIDLTQNFEVPRGENTWKSNEFMDLTQSSDSNDSLPIFNINGTKTDNVKTVKSNISIFDDYNYTHSDDSKKSDASTKLAKSTKDENLDLTQHDSDSFDNYLCDESFACKNITKAPFQEFLNDVLPNLSKADIKLNKTQGLDVKANLDNELERKFSDNSNLCLLQSPSYYNTFSQRSIDRIGGIFDRRNHRINESHDNTELEYGSYKTLSQSFYNATSTGIPTGVQLEDIENLEVCNGVLKNKKSKFKDIISQSYDIFNDNNEMELNDSQRYNGNNKSKDSSSKLSANSKENNRTEDSSSQISNCSQVFVISDEELGYSMQKSRYDDNIDDFNCDISSDDSLPIIKIPGTRVRLKSMDNSVDISRKKCGEEENFIETGNKKDCVNILCKNEANIILNKSVNYKQYSDKSSETLVLDEDIILVKETKSDYVIHDPENPTKNNLDLLSPLTPLQLQTPKKYKSEKSRNTILDLLKSPVAELNDSVIPIDDNNVLISMLDVKGKRTPLKYQKTPKKQEGNAVINRNPMLDYEGMTSPKRNVHAPEKSLDLSPSNKELDEPNKNNFSLLSPLTPLQISPRKYKGEISKHVKLDFLKSPIPELNDSIIAIDDNILVSPQMSKKFTPKKLSSTEKTGINAKGKNTPLKNLTTLKKKEENAVINRNPILDYYGMTSPKRNVHAPEKTLDLTPIKKGLDGATQNNYNLLSPLTPLERTPKKNKDKVSRKTNLDVLESPMPELNDSIIPIDDNNLSLCENTTPKKQDNKGKRTPLKSRKTPKKQVINAVINRNNNSCNTTPIKQDLYETMMSVQTPTNSGYIIKTRDVSPMLDYEGMASPERNVELDKFGIKPIKRKRAIQILEHIYNQTHPIVDANEFELATKRIKLSPRTQMLTRNLELTPKKQIKAKTLPQKSLTNKMVELPPKKIKNDETKVPTPKKRKNNALEVKNDEEINIYEVTSDIPVLKEIYCDPEDWILPKKERVKIKSCRAPLHIVFHNYVSSRARLKEAILCYNPVNIDVIHKELVEYGYKFDAKELLKFLDKKCITVKTSDNNGRNKKSPKKQNKIRNN